MTTFRCKLNANLASSFIRAKHAARAKESLREGLSVARYVLP